MAVVRGDDRRAERACRRTSSSATARAACRRRRRTSARTCGAPWRPSGSASSATRELVTPHAPHDHDARGHGAPRAERPVLQLVRPPHRREARRRGRRPASRSTTGPVVGRQRLARDRPEDRGRAASRSSRAAPARCTTAWTSASTTGRPSTGSSSTTCPTPAASAVLLRHVRLREPDRHLHRRSTQGRDPAAGRVRHLALVRRLVRLELDRDEAGRLQRARYFGTRCSTARCPYNGTLRHPELGRQHVRGADAAAVRARGALGAGQLGREPPADRRRADPPRPRRGRLRLLGLLAREHPRGRLRRLRRRRHRQHPGRLHVEQRHTR